VTTELIDRLGELDTPLVSDALDRLGIDGQCLGITPRQSSFSLVGEAFTVKYVETTGAGGTVGDFIDDLGTGQVAVLDNAGRLDATVWGDLMTTVAKRNDVAGTVIDGVCRDIGRALQLDYPLFTRGHWMRTGKDRGQLEAIQVPVSIGGIVVNPGDLVLGDINGLVSVPRDRAEEVLEAATLIEAAEAGIREEVRSGATLREARARAGYHQLQARRSGHGR
jgi:4-hydroxy-4-methyl-2-oxoglutarate aldolase